MKLGDTRLGEAESAPQLRHVVLIVDDEPDLVDTFTRLLVARGYDCLRAHQAKDAIALIDEARPDLVIADLHLPDLDGLAVLAHARARASPIPGILMTAYSSGRAAMAAYDAGAILYLAKPFSVSQLIAAVDAILR